MLVLHFDKEIPVIAETDVLIVGGGLGGVSAGVMSARQGVNVLVVERYEIRYGALVPGKCNNLLMGCRAISVDHELHGSCRVMPPVCSIGQAAGMAAAMCCHQNCSPAELKGEDVRKNLAQAGAWL